VRIRRIASAAVTFVVAIVVALAMPISQLRTVETVSERCCCPDPAHCHCPSQSPDPTQAPQLKNCHRVSHDVVAPQLPAFSPPEVAIAQPEMIVIGSPVLEPAAPHPAPASRRPDAPS
jgi:hypothetical protein